MGEAAATAGIAEDTLALLKRTNKEKADKKDIRALREFLTESPDAWRVAGDMAALATTHLVDGVKGSVLGRESIRVGVDTLKSELGCGHASPLERLLIEQVIMCWLRLNLLEYQYTTIRDTQTMTIDQADFLEKRLNCAQRRYLRACETLARVRKLVRRTPVLQVNIAAEGGKQVNVLADNAKQAAQAGGATV